MSTKYYLSNKGSAGKAEKLRLALIFNAIKDYHVLLKTVSCARFSWIPSAFRVPDRWCFSVQYFIFCHCLIMFIYAHYFLHIKQILL